LQRLQRLQRGRPRSCRRTSGLVAAASEFSNSSAEDEVCNNCV
jgi:hypothetical protein